MSGHPNIQENRCACSCITLKTPRAYVAGACTLGSSPPRCFHCMCALLALAHWDRRRFALVHVTDSALGVWEGVVLSIAPARLSASAEGGVDYGRRLHCSAGVCPLPSVQGSHQKETRLVPLGWSPRPSNHTCAWQALAFRIVAATPKTPQTQHAATVFQRAGITYSSLAGWLR